ncbi:hypothetical protein KKH23_08235 [Patescibacteria group bacterium]|nr:hypothetical protein [Patescibacteria group bacterium]
MKYHLTDKHPAMIALNELVSKAEELGIRIYNRGFLSQLEYDGQIYDIEDLGNPYQPQDIFPFPIEIKLTFEKD